MEHHVVLPGFADNSVRDIYKNGEDNFTVLQIRENNEDMFLVGMGDIPEGAVALDGNSHIMHVLSILAAGCDHYWTKRSHEALTGEIKRFSIVRGQGPCLDDYHVIEVYACKGKFVKALSIGPVPDEQSVHVREITDFRTLWNEEFSQQGFFMADHPIDKLTWFKVIGEIPNNIWGK